MGAFGMSFGLAAFLAPVVGTQMFAHVGETALWGGAFAACLFAGLGLLAVSEAAERRTPVPNTSAS